MSGSSDTGIGSGAFVSRRGLEFRDLASDGRYFFALRRLATFGAWLVAPPGVDQF